MSNIRQRVVKANRDIVDNNLVVLTFGNASAREGESMYIKPSGIKFNVLEEDNIVSVQIKDGKMQDNTFAPSSDTPTHLELYRAWPEIEGIVHTHSKYATVFAQLGIPIPILGTTHADYFKGPVPVTTDMNNEDIVSDYEVNTGKNILKTFKEIEPLEIPGVLVKGHGPFTWGKNIKEAVDHAVVLEYCAEMYYIMLSSGKRPIKNLCPDLINKHFERKHGPKAYYGQKD